MCVSFLRIHKDAIPSKRRAELSANRQLGIIVNGKPRGPVNAVIGHQVKSRRLPELPPWEYETPFGAYCRLRADHGYSEIIPLPSTLVDFRFLFAIMAGGRGNGKRSAAPLPLGSPEPPAVNFARLTSRRPENPNRFKPVAQLPRRTPRYPEPLPH